MKEYGELTQKLDAQTQTLDQLKSELDQRAARAGACEAEAERLEMLLADLDDQLHDEVASLAKWQQQIQSEESTIAHESSLTGDLETELQQTRQRLTELTVHVRAQTSSKPCRRIKGACKRPPFGLLSCTSKSPRIRRSTSSRCVGRLICKTKRSRARPR